MKSTSYKLHGMNSGAVVFGSGASREVISVPEGRTAKDILGDRIKRKLGLKKPVQVTSRIRRAS